MQSERYSKMDLNYFYVFSVQLHLRTVALRLELVRSRALSLIWFFGPDSLNFLYQKGLTVVTTLSLCDPSGPASLTRLCDCDEKLKEQRHLVPLALMVRRVGVSHPDDVVR